MKLQPLHPCKRQFCVSPCLLLPHDLQVRGVLETFNLVPRSIKQTQKPKMFYSFHAWKRNLCHPTLPLQNHGGHALRPLQVAAVDQLGKMPKPRRVAKCTAKQPCIAKNCQRLEGGESLIRPGERECHLNVACFSFLRTRPCAHPGWIKVDAHLI